MEFSYTKSTDTSTNMVTKDYSKSRMRENRTYGSVRGGQSNLIPSTRLTGLWPRGFLSLTAAMPLRVVEGASKFIEGASLYKTIQPPYGRGNAPLLVAGATTFPPRYRSGDKRKAPLWAG